MKNFHFSFMYTGQNFTMKISDIKVTMLFIQIFFYSHGASRLKIQHEDISKYYNDTRFPYGMVYEDAKYFWKTKGKDFVEEQCSKNIEINIYRSVNRITNLKVQLLKNLLQYEDIVKTKQELTSLRVEELKRDMKVIKCINRKDVQMFIEDGWKEENYFVFTRNDCNQMDISLSLPIPVVNWDVRSIIEEVRNGRLNELYIDGVRGREIYLKGNQYVRNNTYNRSWKNVCHIQGFQLHALCASLHAAGVSLHKERNLKFCIKSNYCMSYIPKTDQVECIKKDKFKRQSDGKIEYFGPVGNGGEWRPLEIMPCAVNTSWTEPNFYFVADQKKDDGVYVLEKIDEHYFGVVMHLEKVEAIKRSFMRPYLFN